MLLIRERHLFQGDTYSDLSVNGAGHVRGRYLRPGALKQKCGNSLQWKQIKHQPTKRNQAQKNFELEKFR